MVKPSILELGRIVFKPDLQPAVVRWLNALQPEQLELFEKVFRRLASDDPADTRELKKKALLPRSTLASKYTLPEWPLFPPDYDGTRKETFSEDIDVLRRATTYFVDYQPYDYDSSKKTRGVPQRTRKTDVSQINKVEQSPEYLEFWGKNTLNTTYKEEICHMSCYNPVRYNDTSEESAVNNVLVYSKGLLNPDAERRALKYLNDPVWLRMFREFCKSLFDAVNRTEYRAEYTKIKKPKGERALRSKWIDFLPEVKGIDVSPEKDWMSESHRAHQAPKKHESRYTAVNLHTAAYSKPFDVHPITEAAATTCLRDDFVDHLASKDEHPMYFVDMKVRIPPGSGVVSSVVGDGKNN